MYTVAHNRYNDRYSSLRSTAYVCRLSAAMFWQVTWCTRWLKKAQRKSRYNSATGDGPGLRTPGIRTADPDLICLSGCMRFPTPIALDWHVTSYVHRWWSGVVVNVLESINEVNQRRTRLVLRWVTVSGFNSRCGTFISVCDQPPRGNSAWPSLRG